ncbi:internal scaffolding protein [Microviridae sp.]|nr:internal scaffolding protein [Microviridae sp.]
MSFNTQPRKRVAINFEGCLALTEQHHKDECDIHNIMRKQKKTGVIEHVNAYQGTYGEMPTGNEFHENMNIIAKAQTMFETVPSHLRNMFENDPAKFLDFMQDPKNKNKMEELGLDASHLPEPAENLNTPAPSDPLVPKNQSLNQKPIEDKKTENVPNDRTK